MNGDIKSTLARMKKAFWEAEVEKIARSLDYNSSELVISALRILRKMRDSSHTAKAMSLLSHFDEKVVVEALKYLKSSQRPLDRRIGQMLMQRGRKVKIQLAYSLELFGYKEGCSLLKKLLEENSTEIRLAALKTAGEFGCEESETILKELTRSEEISVRIATLKALFEMGASFDEETLDRVIFNSSIEESLRKKALKIRLEISTSPEKILQKVMEGGSPALIATAFAFMEKYALNFEKTEEILNQSAIPLIVLSSVLRFILKNENDTSKIEKVALKYRDHPSEKVKILSLRLLDKIDSAYAPDVLSELLFSSNSYILRTVVPYVYRYPTEDNLKKLETLFDNPDERIVGEALKVYRKLKLRNEVALKYLDKTYPLSLRKEALKSVIEFKMIDAATLANLVKNEDDVNMKVIALEGLAKLAPERLSELEVA